MGTVIPFDRARRQPPVAGRDAGPLPAPACEVERTGNTDPPDDIELAAARLYVRARYDMAALVTACQGSQIRAGAALDTVLHEKGTIT